MMASPVCVICGTAAGEGHLPPAERAGEPARLIRMSDGTVECDLCNDGLLEIIVLGSRSPGSPAPGTAS